MECLKGRAFAIVDVETSGTSATFNRVIEIGILRIEEGKCVEEYRTCLNPGRAISPWITSLTGITQEEVSAAPSFEDVLDEIERLLQGAVFVAHNARFDYAFIKNEFKRAGRGFRAKCLCTVRLSRAMNPRARKHDLSSIIDRYGFRCEARHRAFDDARVLWDLLQHFARTYGDRLGAEIEKLLKADTVPQLLGRKDLQDLPEGPGVYIFYGKGGEALYVGKSVNIKNRVLSHFSGDYRATKELLVARDVARIETRETAGELSALLLESSLIKSIHPYYNRQLVKRRELVIARLSRAGEYASITLERVPGIHPDEHREVLGVFRSLAQAKSFIDEAAREHALCKRVMGLEKTRGACFSAQLGICRGACEGKEDAGTYNERFQAAFDARRIAAWPFPGAIMIEERADDLERHSFVINDWCLLGDAKVDADGVEFRASAPEFDLDRYKIFARYLRDPANKKNIRRLPREEYERFLASQNEEAVIS
ncbi:MAG: GIY-YIG nuclease family protein [Candidatus Kaiserbacteria bacterium]|nr:GIY-YIG nuclease family protein [Candidatus Kaiserbacteria bacterium]